MTHLFHASFDNHLFVFKAGIIERSDDENNLHYSILENGTVLTNEFLSTLCFSFVILKKHIEKSCATVMFNYPNRPTSYNAFTIVYEALSNIPINKEESV